MARPKDRTPDEIESKRDPEAGMAAFGEALGDVLEMPKKELDRREAIYKKRRERRKKRELGP